MNKTKRLPGHVRAKIIPNRFEQMKGANHIGLQKCLRPVDRAVHMRLGREMNHPCNRLLREDLADRLSRLADRHIADRETRVKASGAEACFRALGNTSSTLPYRPVKEPSLLQLAAERIWNA